jgi:hypothetical protein
VFCSAQVLETYFHLGLKVLSVSQIVAMTTLVVQHVENSTVSPATFYKQITRVRVTVWEQSQSVK